MSPVCVGPEPRCASKTIIAPANRAWLNVQPAGCASTSVTGLAGVAAVIAANS